jgi:bifunctional non-homologous end joining protein LigD
MAKKPPSLPKSAPLRREVEPPLVSRPVRVRRPEQPELPFDPMPARIEPCLATLVDKPPAGEDWVFEIKWDGYRMAVHVEPNRVRALSRNNIDWTDRVPAIVSEARKIAGTMILDGEAVILDEQGRSDFSKLQSAFGGRGGKRASGEVILYAFDLLYLDGHDLTGMSLHERRDMLETLIGDRTGAIRLSETIHADGAQLLKQACSLGLEGIIAKRDDRPYRSGRTGDWLKIKCVQSESFFIVGYEQSAVALGGIGRLLLAARKGDGLVYVGGVGIGFTRGAAAALKRMMDKTTAAAPSVDTGKKRPGVIWLRPELIAEINFRGWTGDGKLRHASYKGLREAADSTVVYEISEASR